MVMDATELNKLQQRSVQTFPSDTTGVISVLFSLAASADEIPAWGANPRKRDMELRKLARDESWLASTIASLAARNAAFSWTVESAGEDAPETCREVQGMLVGANFGKGWQHLVMQVSRDLYETDNGAFVEIIRGGNSPTAPVLGLAHKDSQRCIRTGNLQYPVVYTDREGGQHKLAWYQVMDFTDSPSTDETMYGVGLCAASRALEYSQLLRDIVIYQREKASGRNPSALHVVSGVSTTQMTDVLHKASENADNKGLLRWQLPAVLGTVDPTAKVDIATILLKSLPDNFDLEKWMKWFVALMAMAFQCEYQDLAPLPGTGLGSSTQSEILHMKARGKGAELFQKMIEHRLNYYVLPSNVRFRFTEKDIQQEIAESNVKYKKAQKYQLFTAMGIPVQLVAQIMEDEGELKEEYLQALQQMDFTPEASAVDNRYADPVNADDADIPKLKPTVPIAPAAATPTIKGNNDFAKKYGKYLAAKRDAALETTQKQLTSDDYYGEQRAKMEADYKDEMQAALNEVKVKIAERMGERADT